ncbi:MAG: hypothetical protein GXP55_01345 [Deltaproteobacteria bacterium]|nr:hypothetical protein [Deltaproteobacteria bacterium]
MWGAGTIGQGVARRLVMEPHVSELHWINRDPKVEGFVHDLKHGLMFSPSCHEVRSYRTKDSDFARARIATQRSELVILTLGKPVPEGGTRADLYPGNRALFRELVIPALSGFGGIVLVVSNPVELLARLVQREGELEARRVIGLGTLVETARARAALADHLSPARPARDIELAAVGTHDEHAVLQPLSDFGLDDAERDTILEAVRKEMINGAKRVKKNALATQHPIVEAAAAVIRAVANDAHALLPVASLAPDDPDGLYWSVPCIVSARGIIGQRPELLTPAVVTAMAPGVQAMRRVLQSHPN